MSKKAKARYEFFEYLKSMGTNWNFAWDYNRETNEETQDDNTVVVPWCVLGNNFYDYGEDEPEEMDIDEDGEKLIQLAECAGINLIYRSCYECSGCGGW